MAWTTPTLKEVRGLARDHVTAALRSASLIGNSITRVLADAGAMLAHLVLLYIDWLAKQLLPDTATEWLDRHGVIWLRNADGSLGRKAATYASGTVLMSGVFGVVVPAATPLRSALGMSFETSAAVTIGEGATEVPVVALDAGTQGNVPAGEPMTLGEVIPWLDTGIVVQSMQGGTDEEGEDDLRERVLFRIQNPPMGGCDSDYVAWAKSLAGVTRAWVYPNEMGIGTVTVRFMMDVLRADNGGIPLPEDVEALTAYLDTVRPVTTKDFFVEAPIPHYYNVTITELGSDDLATRAAIIDAVKTMERGRMVTLADGRQEWRVGRAKPGQTMYRSWVDEAVSQAIGEDHHEMTFTSIVMPAPGYMPMLGTIRFL